MSRTTRAIARNKKIAEAEATAARERLIRKAQADEINRLRIALAAKQETAAYAMSQAALRRSQTTVASFRGDGSVSPDTRKREYSNTAVANPRVTPHIGSDAETLALFADIPA